MHVACCLVQTKNWTDWIDYWAVDFNFESKREIIRVKNEDTGLPAEAPAHAASSVAGGSAQAGEWEEQ